MKQAIEQLVTAAAEDRDSDLRSATTPDLVLALGKVAEDGIEGDLETLDALDALLCELDMRSDVDANSRRYFARLHKGVREQL